MTQPTTRLFAFVCLGAFGALILAACGETIIEGPQPPPGVAPNPPGSVEVTAGADRIGVRWTDQSSDESEFVIARVVLASATLRPQTSELAIVGSVGAGQTTFEDRDVETARIYFYAVAARSSAGTSELILQNGPGNTLTLMGSTCGGPATATDGDGDGLTDALEAEGWTVLVDEDGRGSLTMRPVKSSPFEADTDHDGLCDNEESTLRIDPRRADTDGDGLTDLDEVNRWGSSPTSVDSDGDSTGNSSFYDGSELLDFGTSPTLADSDGDGRSDFEEINQNGTNALVAELPQPKIELVGRMDLGVNVMLENGTVVTDAETNSYERGTSSSLENTSETANTQSVESSYTLSTEATVGYPLSAGVSVSGSYSEKTGYVQESSSSWSRESRKSAQETYERLTSNAISSNQEIVDGHIAMNIEIANQGTRTFEISGLVITALQRSRSNPTTFISIASLDLPVEADGIVLGEGDRRGPFRAEATIPANVALDLLANPTTTFFKAASFQLTDRGGENFEFTIGEETNNRTALLTIDFGGVRPMERYRVATNVERSADGRAAGVRLGDVMQRILGLAPDVGYQTSDRADGVAVLTRIRDVESVPRPGGGAERFWALIAPPNPDVSLPSVTDRLLSKTTDFDDLVLMPRDALILAYVADHDEDGLFEREERMYGTFDELVDSDGDGLSDFEEARVGWRIDVDVPFYRANPQVYSNPALADADGDGWDDRVEQTMGTDPNRRDTDNDGLVDPADPAPTRGPSGSWVQILGTSQTDVIHQVLTSSDTVFLLGQSDGDIDGDGTAGGAFVMALEAETGTVRWTTQIEATGDYVKEMVAQPDGSTLFIGEVGVGGLPGVSTPAIYALVWDRAGVLAPPVDLTNAGYQGHYTPANMVPSAIVPGAGGLAMSISPYTLFNGGAALDLANFDNAGVYGGSSAYSGTGFVPVVKDVGSAGRLAVAAVDYGANGCAALVIRNSLELQGQVTYCSGAHPGRVGKVGIDSQNALYVASRVGAQDVFERVDLTGGLLWSRNFLPDINVPWITSIDIDLTDQIYVGLQDNGAGAPAALEIRRTDGSRSAILRLGNSTTAVNGAVRDRVGNLYSGATSAGGFEAYGTSLGGSDLIVVRNPQLVFGP